MSDLPEFGSIKSSLSKLFSRDRKREEQLNALSDILDYGTEEQYLELLVSWKVPAGERAFLLQEFRKERNEKRGLLL
jgi:hypothetical protein